MINIEKMRAVRGNDIRPNGIYSSMPINRLMMNGIKITKKKEMVLRRYHFVLSLCQCSLFPVSYVFQNKTNLAAILTSSFSVTTKTKVTIGENKNAVA